MAMPDSSVELEEDDAEDIFIPESELNGAFHKDKVQVRLLPKDRQNGPRSRPASR